MLHDDEVPGEELTAIWKLVFAKAGSIMGYVEEEGRSTDVWRDSFTAKRAADMLLKRMGANKMQILLHDDMLFFQRMVECMVDHGCDQE